MKNMKSMNMKKTFPAVLAFVCILVAGLMPWGCTTDSEVQPTLTIVTPANNSSVAGPNVLLRVKTTHFTFANGSAKASASEAAISGGHIHVYLDKPIGTDADAITILTQADTTTIPESLSAGWHYIIVQGANANHDDVASMVDSVKFYVTAVP